MLGRRLIRRRFCQSFDDLKNSTLKGMTELNLDREEDFMKFAEMQNLNDGWFSNLEDRRVLSISGSDATVFLQDMSTQNMRKFEAQKDRRALYSIFLNAKGRIKFDAIIVKPELAGQREPHMEYWIDCNADSADALMKHFRTYALRKHVEVNDISEFIKVTAYQHTIPPGVQPGMVFADLQNQAERFPSEEFDGELETDHICFIDPRLQEAGVRILSPENCVEFGGQFATFGSSKQYHLIRSLLGFAETPGEMEGKLPLNLNTHLLNGISFKKGCYLGHELTQRTYHSGVLRRSLVPFKISSEPHDHLFNPFNHLDTDVVYDWSGMAIENDQGKSIGKVVSTSGNAGLAMVKLDAFEEEGRISGKVDGADIRLWLQSYNQPKKE